MASVAITFTANLIPVLKIIQNNPEKHCPRLYLSFNQSSWQNDENLNVMSPKVNSKMNPSPCANSHHDVTDLEVHEMFRNINIKLYK